VDLTTSDLCSHTGRPVVPQRTLADCLTCCLAMLTGRGYDEVTRAAQAIFPGHEAGGLLTHNLMRRIAHDWGFALLSSIYMDWRHPGIVGVVSRTIENCGHALFWDGARLIDPGGTGAYDLAYVHANAIEFTQRAGDLAAVIALEQSLQPAAHGVCDAEYF
jgi:hypothetical protein